MGRRAVRLEEADPKGLVRESYNIEGITLGECRSIFMDWALSLPVGNEALWWGLDIKAGIPHLEAVHQGEYIPQMLNLQALEGISFTKGCYMGQEIVARAKYRGANNRALFVLSGTAATQVASGDTLEIQLGDNWRRSGLVLNAWQQQGQVWLTAVP